MEPNNNPVGVPNSINNTNNFASNNAAMEAQVAVANDQITNLTNQQPQESPVQENKIAVEPVENKSKSKGMMLAVALLALVALGGIGFGVWTMMDGENQKEELNKTIDSLKKTNNQLNDQVAELNDKIEKLQKEATNGNNNSGNNSNNGNDNSGNGTVNNDDANAFSKITAEVVGGAFVVKDGDGTVLADSDARTVTEIISCDNATSTSSLVLKCAVNTSEGQGVYEYDWVNKSLNFILDSARN